ALAGAGGRAGKPRRHDAARAKGRSFRLGDAGPGAPDRAGIIVTRISADSAMRLAHEGGRPAVGPEAKCGWRVRLDGGADGTAVQPVFDGHNDVLLRLWQHARAGGDPVAEFRDGAGRGHISLPKAQAGGLAGGLCAIFVPSGSYALAKADAAGHYAT